jgi:hypothetical protein
LPRNVFLAPSLLGQFSTFARILPVTRADQVIAKTAFASGYFKGHYLNAYASVPQALLVAAGGRTRAVSVTVRNAAKAYDLPIACEATPSIQCGNFIFHGKSLQVWNETLEWQAFDSEGRLLNRVSLRPRILGGDGDTGLAVTWAASPGRFSELKEYPAGPAYGFADAWASLLALEKDSLPEPRKTVFADSGVPRIVNENINDVIENYNGQVPPCCGNPTPIINASRPLLADAATWRVERERGGIFALRIPGLDAGSRVELTLFDLGGRRMGSWSLLAEAGTLRWNSSGIRSGAYLLQIRAQGIQGIKKVVL